MEFRYFCEDCGKCYVGARLPGKMTCNCGPPKQITGQMLIKPLSPELTTLYSVSEAYNLRNELCQLWGIVNKTHKQHGSNFSGNQTLVQLITNIVDPVAKNDWERVRGLVRTKYKYDITTKQMED